VIRRPAIDNAAVARCGACLLVVACLLAAPWAHAQTSQPQQAPPAEYPPPGYAAPGYPPGGYPPGGYPPPTAYAPPPPGWVPIPVPEPHPRRVFSLTLSPLHLLIGPIVELTGEARVHDKVGLALIGGVGKYSDNSVGVSASVFEAGGQVRVYVVGDFRHGMQLGGELLYLHLSDTSIAATGEGVAVGPFLGYKVMADAGFTFDAQVGFEHVSARAQSGTSTAANKDFIPLLNLNIGWSF
jgi:hypothetical protein